MKNTFYRLLDSDYFGTIIKVSGKNVFRFDLELNDWKETGLMILFYSDESDKYELYEEISEEQANDFIKEAKRDKTL
ncbi:hypothetical protein [Enterococcus sp. BWR-S5]|uniref:hypothetical protein n=1 Tax=Enterococcus sp. BWR-S5 TaxID=2787714 RepID=UPI00192359A9|nr:hypothetical protein [Enterococcus sp. BWR-S5]MBL1225377.1 hypothetical protein [Enterococcus sp. BWR-S5]